MGVKTLYAYLGSGEIIPCHGQTPHLFRVSLAAGVLVFQPYRGGYAGHVAGSAGGMALAR